MGLDFSTLVYFPCQEVFGRPVTVTPLVSLPGYGPYTRRGIFRTRDVIIEGGEIGAVLSDQQSVLYVRDVEFPAVPQQGDLISIGADRGIPPPGKVRPTDSAIEFLVTDVPTRGGGETTLVLQRVEP